MKKQNQKPYPQPDPIRTLWDKTVRDNGTKKRKS